MSYPPQVAVLLSTYDGERYLREQLESLRTQQDVRVILHARDDGSTDKTAAILREHAKIWQELANITSGPNMRPVASFMHLLRSAPTAEYYAFCDQDDVWLPNKLSRAVEAISQQSGPALYCANVSLVDECLNLLAIAAPHEDLSFEHLLFENFATGCTIVMNNQARDLLTQVAPDPCAIVMHDWWCALVIAALGHVHYDAQPMIQYRQHSDNVVGYAPSWIARNLGTVRRLMRKPSSFYPIHKQAEELLRLYGDNLPLRERNLVKQLVWSRQSVVSRLQYGLTGPIKRRDAFSNLVVRGLIAANLY